MKYFFFVFLFLSSKSFAECAFGTDLGPTLTSSFNTHPEKLEPYKLQGDPIETKLASIAKKYGISVERTKIPALANDPEESRACVTEYEFQVKNEQGDFINAYCVVSARFIKNSTSAYSVSYCEKATEDKILAKKLNFNNEK